MFCLGVCTSVLCRAVQCVCMFSLYVVGKDCGGGVCGGGRGGVVLEGRLQISLYWQVPNVRTYLR